MKKTAIAGLATEFIVVCMCVIQWPIALQAPLSMGSPGKNTREGYWALLQGIFLTQGSNSHLLCLLHREAGPLLLGPPGKPFLNE